MSENGEITTDHSGETSSGQEAEKKSEGLELLLCQVDRLSQLIQQEIEEEEPSSPEDEAEFQEYMRGWVAEYQRLVQAGPEHQSEALEVLGMIRALLGNAGCLSFPFPAVISHLERSRKTNGRPGLFIKQNNSRH